MDQPIHDYYNHYDEEGRLLLQYGKVEFLTTMRYIEKYLSDHAKILEIGAGTGQYSHALARKGYHVDAVELVEHNIDIFKSKTEPDEAISICQGNAMDLHFISDEVYDLTMVLGPMYHLFTKEDKKKALSEALRVTKKDGVVFCAYCISDSSILDFGFKKGNIFNLLEKGMIDESSFKTVSKSIDIFELLRKEDIDELMSSFNVERLHYVGTDMYTKHMQDVVSEMDEKTFDLYLKYHFTICERPDMVGLTYHSLDVFRKKSS